MIQYSIKVLNTNRPQKSLFHESRKATVEVISKQLKCINKGHNHSNANYDYCFNAIAECLSMRYIILRGRSVPTVEHAVCIYIYLYIFLFIGLFGSTV